MEVPNEEQFKSKHFLSKSDATTVAGFGSQILATVYGLSLNDPGQGGTFLWIALAVLVFPIIAQSIVGGSSFATRIVFLVISWIGLGAVVVFGNSNYFIGCLCS